MHLELNSMNGLKKGIEIHFSYVAINFEPAPIYWKHILSLLHLGITFVVNQWAHENFFLNPLPCSIVPFVYSGIYITVLITIAV